jgi:hypothetical protein
MGDHFLATAMAGAPKVRIRSLLFLLGVFMPHPLDPKNESLTTDTSEQLTAEAELLEENFESADTLEDFTKVLMESLTSKLHANIDEIFKQNK